MKRVFNLLIAIAGAILAAAFISSLVSLSLWLDMRVHSRYIYYVCLAIAIVASLLGKVNEKTFLIIELISIAGILLLGKFMRAIYELREVMHIDIGIDLLKQISIIALIVINLMLFLKFLIKKKKSA
ncbi:hypothetical protein [Fenollaria timonensis]|uniref:hypothetical protein n=1 Tax=Fenollaria timonensis TaxID=1723384 RepID=UPI0026E947C2|nr:hypothetical protein [Fenollaria timonensis]